MNVVVLAPHTDDEALGCGGTIAKLIERGYDVYVYAFSIGLANMNEYRNCVRVLGAKDRSFHFQSREFNFRRQAILDALVGIKQDLEPRMVFTPNSKDVHQDHHTIYEETLRAFKHTTIYGYELPWNSFGFDNSMYSVLSPEHISVKMRALKEYESQERKIYFQEENILSLARVRGMQANTEYAEAFEVIRSFL
jgi:N-acetylglucosamine malate deacetylase 1